MNFIYAFVFIIVTLASLEDAYKLADLPGKEEHLPGSKLKIAFEEVLSNSVDESPTEEDSSINSVPQGEEYVVTIEAIPVEETSTVGSNEVEEDLFDPEKENLETFEEEDGDEAKRRRSNGRSAEDYLREILVALENGEADAPRAGRDSHAPRAGRKKSADYKRTIHPWGPRQDGDSRFESVGLAFPAPRAGRELGPPLSGRRILGRAVDKERTAPRAGRRSEAPRAGRETSAPRAGRALAPRAGRENKAPRAGRDIIEALRASGEMNAPRAGRRDLEAPRAGRGFLARRADRRTITAPRAGRETLEAPRAGRETIEAPQAGRETIEAPRAGREILSAPRAGRELMDAPRAGRENLANLQRERRDNNEKHEVAVSKVNSAAEAPRAGREDDFGKSASFSSEVARHEMRSSNLQAEKHREIAEAAASEEAAEELIDEEEGEANEDR